MNGKSIAMSGPEPKLRFIDEPIEAVFESPPLLEKTPTCPQGFIWRGRQYAIRELISEWKDFRRRGRMAQNMIPAHRSRAERVGSWGVGRFFFRVRTDEDRVFDLYFDRTPLDAGDRKGKWVLFAERLG